VPKKLSDAIQAEFGENVFLCYQCIRCTVGCPLAEYFDLTPNQVLRALQLGQDDVVLNSKTIWLCASCQTCVTRCPQQLDLPRVMDFLKSEAQARGIAPKVPEVALFHKVFLRDVDILGRAYELGLIAEMNLRTGQPFKDVDLGLEMIRKRKVKLLPGFARLPKRARPKEHAAHQIAYYPGCSLHSLASELDISTRTVCRELGIDLVEVPGWICCGSTSAHSTDHHLATLLPLRNLAVVEQEGFTEVTLPCAMCFSRFRTATHDLAHDGGLKERLDAEMGYEYRGQVKVENLLQTLIDKVGLDALRAKVTRPLTGLKVASYYGCLLARPPEVTGEEHHEYPMAMDRLMCALGAQALDWNGKTDCCGGSLSLTQTSIALDLSRKIIAQAREVGADLIATACPLCHINLDGRQAQMGLDYAVPVVYFTQLMGLAFGLDPRDVALHKNMVEAMGVLGKVQRMEGVNG